MPESMEQRLANALAPVQAPPELWERLAPAPPRRSWLNFVMAVAAAALLAGGAMYLRAANTQPAAPLMQAAITMHRGAPAGVYAVQRYPGDITVVSMPGADPAAAKQIRTVTQGGLSISEWSFGGRRWAMVSTTATHRQACSVCHRA